MFEENFGSYRSCDLASSTNQELHKKFDLYESFIYFSRHRLGVFQLPNTEKLNLHQVQCSCS